MTYRDLVQPLMIWRAFATVYKGNEDITYHRSSVNNPELEDLPVYIDRMNSRNLDWLVCVTINEPRFPRQDVVNIANLRNVVVLDIGAKVRGSGSNDALVSDSVIRAWARAAHEDGAFPKLQALLIRNQPEVTHQALTYLHMFPSLVLFGVEGCFSPHRSTPGVAEIHGWTTEDTSGTLRKIERDIIYGSTWDSHLTTCYRHTLALLPSELRELMLEQKPMLSFRLGMTHSSVLTSNVFDRMTFFRSTSGRSCATITSVAPKPAETMSKSATIPSTASRTSLTRSNTRTIKRKKHMDVFDVFQNDFGMPSMVSTPSSTGAPMQVSSHTPVAASSAKSISTSSAATSGVMNTPQHATTSSRHSMPPPPTPVRSTSTFDLTDVMTSQSTAASETRAPRGSYGLSNGSDGSASSNNPGLQVRNNPQHARRENSSQERSDEGGPSRRTSQRDDGKWSPRSKL
jgi:hypothetical protein